jgi:hypothetical protein
MTLSILKIFYFLNITPKAMDISELLKEECPSHRMAKSKN